MKLLLRPVLEVGYEHLYGIVSTFRIWGGGERTNDPAPCCPRLSLETETEYNVYRDKLVEKATTIVKTVSKLASPYRMNPRETYLLDLEGAFHELVRLGNPFKCLFSHIRSEGFIHGWAGLRSHPRCPPLRVAEGNTKTNTSNQAPTAG